jgi:hypothetical protein
MKFILLLNNFCLLAQLSARHECTPEWKWLKLAEQLSRLQLQRQRQEAEVLCSRHFVLFDLITSHNGSTWVNMVDPFGQYFTCNDKSWRKKSIFVINFQSAVACTTTKHHQ